MQNNHVGPLSISLRWFLEELSHFEFDRRVFRGVLSPNTPSAQKTSSLTKYPLTKYYRSRYMTGSKSHRVRRMAQKVLDMPRSAFGWWPCSRTPQEHLFGATSGGFSLTFKRIVQVTHPIFRVGHYPRKVLACPGLSAPSSVLDNLISSSDITSSSYTPPDWVSIVLNLLALSLTPPDWVRLLFRASLDSCINSTEKRVEEIQRILPPQYHGSLVWNMHCRFALCVPSSCYSNRECLNRIRYLIAGLLYRYRRA